MTLRHLLATAALCAAGTAAANPTALVTTLAAPAELQLGQYDLYRVTVRNPSVYPANGVLLRLAIGPNVQLAPEQPANCVIVANQPLVAGGPNVRQVRCALATLPAGTTWVWDFFLRGAASAAPFSRAHQAAATATNLAAGAQLSPVVTTSYQDFSLAVQPDSHWAGESCWKGNGLQPVPYGICTTPASQNLPGTFRLRAGGVVDATESPHLGTGTTATWSQPANHKRVNYAEPGDPAWGYTQATAVLRIINSRCFRGEGQTQPTPGNPVYYNGFKICLIP